MEGIEVLSQTSGGVLESACRDATGGIALFIMLYSMAWGINDVQLYLNLSGLRHPVCGLTCYREQQQGFTFGKEEKGASFLL